MSLAEIHSRMKAAAAVARLPLQSGRWSGTAGTVLGRGTGSSIEFQDHRHYTPGDDPRHINWQASARTGQFTMKLFREEVTPRIDLVCDVSGSMFLDQPKERRVWELIYFCLESSLRVGGHLRLFLLGRSTADQPTERPPVGNSLMPRRARCVRQPSHRRPVSLTSSTACPFARVRSAC